MPGRSIAARIMPMHHGWNGGMVVGWRRLRMLLSAVDQSIDQSQWTLPNLSNLIRPVPVRVSDHHLGSSIRLFQTIHHPTPQGSHYDIQPIPNKRTTLGSQ